MEYQWMEKSGQSKAVEWQIGKLIKRNNKQTKSN